ncbi:hypothetical protein Tco_0449085 [Tanacetum coccineum]
MTYCGGVVVRGLSDCGGARCSGVCYGYAREVDIIKKTENQAKHGHKLEHENGKDCAKSRHKVQMSRSGSILKNQQSIRDPEMKILLIQSTPSDGGKANSLSMKTVKTNGPSINSNSHLCAIDKDCEDFEGPILSPVSAILCIVHTIPILNTYWA